MSDHSTSCAPSSLRANDQVAIGRTLSALLEGFIKRDADRLKVIRQRLLEEVKVRYVAAFNESVHKRGASPYGP